MLRLNGITFLIFDDVYKLLSKYEYKELELSENNDYIFVKAKKSYDGHLFDVDF